MGRRLRHIGRAAVRRGDVGRAQVSRAVGRASTPDKAATSLIRIADRPPRPVFVDTSGRRRRRLRRVAYAVGAVLLVALVGVWLSLLVGGMGPVP